MKGKHEGQNCSSDLDSIFSEINKYINDSREKKL